MQVMLCHTGAYNLKTGNWLKHHFRTGSYSGDRDKAGPRKRLIQIPSEHSTPVIRESFGKFQVIIARQLSENLLESYH